MLTRIRQSIEWRIGLLAAAAALALTALTFLAAMSRHVSDRDLKGIEKLSEAYLGVEAWAKASGELRATLARVGGSAVSPSQIETLQQANLLSAVRMPRPSLALATFKSMTAPG